MIQCVKEADWNIVLVLMIDIFNQIYTVGIDFNYLVYVFDLEHDVLNI